MDIKSKSTKEIIFNYIIFILLLTFISTGILTVINISKTYKQQLPGNIYSNSTVANEIDDFIGMTLDDAIYYKNDEYVSNPDNITQYEIDTYKKNIQDKIEEEYENRKSALENEYDYSEPEKLENILKEERKKIEEKYNYTADEILNNILEAKKVAYENLKLQINAYNNIKFSAYDNVNKIWIGEGEIKEQNLLKSTRYFSKRIVTSNKGVEELVYLNGNRTENPGIVNRIKRLESGYYTSGNYVSSYIQQQSPQYYYMTNYNIDLYIWIPKNIQKGDKIYSAFDEINQNQKGLFGNAIVLAISIGGVLLTSFIRKKGYNTIFGLDLLINKIKKYPIEYKIGSVIIAEIIYKISYSAYDYNSYYGDYENYNNLTFNNVLYTVLLLLVIYIVIKTLVTNYNEHTLFENNITREIIDTINGTKGKSSVVKKLFRGIAMYIAVTIVLLVITIATNNALFIPCFIAGILMTMSVVISLIKKMAYLDKIMVGAREAANGKFNYKIDEKGTGQLAELAHNINNIKDGLRASLSNEMKSEKMKSELITNVSHDLKTPLTSIINYINLLKMEDIKPENAKDYIAVLDNKSQRLKILIEDLFEASKAASGEMKLNIARIDIVQLLQQILGEFDEKLIECGLELKANIPNEKIYIDGDGRRLFRVFENLISNISKYALNNTRVYVDLVDKEDYVEIIMKNISSYELKFNADEITNRFIRGDEARTSEGSGLGLAIAKSIVELHGGKLTIEVDGDLFKSIIILNK